MLALHRVCIRWNQTGQKHAGAHDIANSFLPAAHVLLWLLVLATYGYMLQRLTRRTFTGIVPKEAAVLVAMALVLPALVFKLNFTQADAPELVQGLAVKIREWTEPFGLITQARVVFTGLGGALILVVGASMAASWHSKMSVVDGKTVVFQICDQSC